MSTINPLHLSVNMVLSEIVPGKEKSYKAPNYCNRVLGIYYIIKLPIIFTIHSSLETVTIVISLVGSVVLLSFLLGTNHMFCQFLTYLQQNQSEFKIRSYI